MKVFYEKQPSNIVRYYNYENLVMKFSLTILESISLKIQSFLSSDSFKRTIDKTLEKYVPLKKRYVRANQAPFMNKNK